jgi:hypothetical protein
MAPFLFGGLMALIATGLVGIFIPFNSTVDLIYASGGCLIFSGYIIFDTFTINKKLSPDEYIMGAISLYLDFLNLCECPLIHSLTPARGILYSKYFPFSLEHPPCLEQPQRPVKVTRAAHRSYLSARSRVRNWLWDSWL